MHIDEELTGLYFWARRPSVATHFSVLILCTTYNKLSKHHNREGSVILDSMEILVCFLTWLLGVPSGELMFNFSVLSNIMN